MAYGKEGESTVSLADESSKKNIESEKIKDKTNTNAKEAGNVVVAPHSVYSNEYSDGIHKRETDDKRKKEHADKRALWESASAHTVIAMQNLQNGLHDNLIL